MMKVTLKNKLPYPVKYVINSKVFKVKGFDTYNYIEIEDDHKLFIEARFFLWHIRTVLDGNRKEVSISFEKKINTKDIIGFCLGLIAFAYSYYFRKMPLEYIVFNLIGLFLLLRYSHPVLNTESQTEDRGKVEINA